jgi:hypothetical protein
MPTNIATNKSMGQLLQQEMVTEIECRLLSIKLRF